MRKCNDLYAGLILFKEHALRKCHSRPTEEEAYLISDSN